MIKHNRPNFVVIISDDQGYGDLGCFGNPFLSTPNLDLLATQGTTFTQHYSASPICAPARAGFLTGHYNHMTGALSVESNRKLDRINITIPTIGDFMSDSGYSTGLVGKWHNGAFSKRHHPNSRGFTEFVGFLNGGMGYYDWFLDYNGVSHQSDGRYLTDVFATEATEFISRHKNDSFFLCVTFNAPHAPFEAPPGLIEKYQSLGHLDEGVCRIYAMLEQMDIGIGKILNHLKQLNLEQNTVILFTSDNGPLLGKRGGFNLSRYNGPFRGAKTEVLEGGIRVPAILRWPDCVPSNRQENNMVHFIDWLPTILDMAGVKYNNPDFDGESCYPLLKGDTGCLNTKRFWQFNRYDPVARCNAAMRDGKWKLWWGNIPEAMKKIPADNDWYKRLMKEPHFYTELLDNPSFEREIPKAGKPELFDIESDPSESVDLSSKFPAIVSSMTHQLDNWFDEVNEKRLDLVRQMS